MSFKKEDLLNFEWMPEELKEYVYRKYQLDSIYLKTLGKIDEDYTWVVVVYDCESEGLLNYSYTEFEELLNNSIFRFFPDIQAGTIQLINGVKVIIETIGQKQALELLGYYEDGT